MEPDRETPGEPGRAAGHSSAPQPHPDSAGRDYDYGDIPLEPAGAGGPSAADGGASEGAHPVSDHDPGSVPATGVPTGTAPRAVLRPVPEGFPTPPPRPARPNRRPAPAPDASAPSSRPRALVIAGIVAAIVLLLAVAVGGGVLALRSLPSSAPAASDPVASDPAASDPAGPDPAPAGTARIGEITVEEVSTEVAVRAVGDSGARLEPEGEFVIITFTVRNPTDQVLTVSDNMTLETADGAGHAADQDAGAAHVTPSRPYGLVPVGGDSTFHAVFDVPIGAEPTALRLDFRSNADAGEGTLPLGG